uniref:Pc60, similar to hemolysin-like n=1 Tax=Panstrongylus chinai TaxID=156444 RepID=A0A286T5P2_9HEMI|nr:Pc60, similar to hemolysin-like [Panstrongylus chinai]
MPIALFFFYSLLLGTSLGQQYGSNRTLNKVLGNVGNVVNQGIDLEHERVKLTTKLTNSGVEHGTNIGKMGVAAGATLSSQGLGGGTDLAKEGLELVGTVGEIIPGAGVPVNYVTEAGKTGLTIVNNLGQKGIKVTTHLGNQALDNTKTITKIASGTVENFSSARTGVAKETVSTGLNALANVLNTGMDAGMALVPGTTTQPNESPENSQPVSEPAPESNAVSSLIQRGWSYFGGNQDNYYK